MEPIIFKRKMNSGMVEIPQELIDYMGFKEGTEIGFCAETKNGKNLRLWNQEVPRPILKRVKKN